MKIKTYQNLWNAAKAVPKGNFISVNGYFKRRSQETSGQDGGIGRHTVPPRTTKRRITTNLKTKATRTDRRSNCMEVQ